MPTHFTTNLLDLVSPYFRQIAHEAGKAYVEPILTDEFKRHWKDDDYTWMVDQYAEILKLSPLEVAVRM